MYIIIIAAASKYPCTSPFCQENTNQSWQRFRRNLCRGLRAGVLENECLWKVCKSALHDRMDGSTVSPSIRLSVVGKRPPCWFVNEEVAGEQYRYLILSKAKSQRRCHRVCCQQGDGNGIHTVVEEWVWYCAHAPRFLECPG